MVQETPRQLPTCHVVWVDASARRPSFLPFPPHRPTLQAVQYVAEHGEVCPAGWKPGDKTMVADPEKSLEYFEAVGGEEVGVGGVRAWACGRVRGSAAGGVGKAVQARAARRQEF